MRKARIAEWILSLVTSLQRAESTVGDLLEEDAGRGTFRFWKNVGWTALSLLWRTFPADWQHIAGAGTLGLLLECLGRIATLAIAGVGIGLLAGALVVTRAVGPQHVPVWAITAFELIGAVIGLAGSTWVDFQVGRWLAHRSPGQELAACLGLMAVEQIVATATAILWSVGFLDLIPSLTVWHIPLFVLHLPLFTGAVLVRRRRVAG